MWINVDHKTYQLNTGHAYYFQHNLGKVYYILWLQYALHLFPACYSFGCITERIPFDAIYVFDLDGTSHIASLYQSNIWFEQSYTIHFVKRMFLFNPRNFHYQKLPACFIICWLFADIIRLIIVWSNWHTY